MKTNQEIKIKEKNLDLIKTLRSEFHFLKYPFFNLCTNKTKRIAIEIREIEQKEGSKIETLWRASRNTDTDFPSLFAKKIHVQVVEKNLNNIKKPIPRLIRLGSLRQICRNINITPSGKNVIKIKKALEDIHGVTIKTKKTFRLKESNGQKNFFEGRFHLYDGIYFLGEQLPNGEIADSVYVLLNDLYCQNINNNFIVPLDYDYMHSLNGGITARMYELFIIWFYPVFTKKKKHIEKKYSELYNYFPLIPQNIKWKAKKQLKSAHLEHVSSGFLKCEPEWKDIGKKDDWGIRYYIGPRAEEWYYSIKHDKQPVEIQEQKQITEPIEENKPEDNPLLSRLLALKISRNRAEKLIKNHNNDNIIEYWIDALDVLKPQNRAGFLVTALKEKWELPEHIRKKRVEKIKKREEKLKIQYYENIFAQVEKRVEENMSKEEFEKKIEQHKEVFLQKYPAYKQFENKIFLMPYVKDDYRRVKAEELGLMTFEEWKEQRI